MYSYAKECISTKPPKCEFRKQVEQETVPPLKRECKSFLDICQEKEVPELEPEFQYGKYLIENITVVNPPLPKVYYWECFDIDGLNSCLSGNDAEITHSFILYPRLLYTRPLKVIFWLRNQEKPLNLKVKRVKSCDCTLKQTKVGFNQFRDLYHCPHRRLIYLAKEEFNLVPNDLVALSLTFFFIYVGKNVVTFELISSDGRLLTLNIAFEVDSLFAPESCVLTKELVPVNIDSFKRFIQPIWVRNLTTSPLTFSFLSNNRGVCLINTNLTVPSQSIWPLLIQHRAADYMNEIELTINFQAISGSFKIKGEGTSGNHRIKYTCPVLDYKSSDSLYTIYPNRLEICSSFNKTRTVLICVNNHSQECAEFLFQDYILNDYFAVAFEPQTFRLKPHHPKLIQVTIKTFERAMYFTRIPLIMEVHKVFSKGAEIAKKLISEVESCDDPKWLQDSYQEHCYLHMDIVIDVPPVSKCLDPPCCPVPPEEISRYTNMENVCVPPPPATRNTIFEKLFFEYLADSDFLKDKEYSKEYKLQSYQELLGLPVDEEQFNKSKKTYKIEKTDKTNKPKKMIYAIPSSNNSPTIKTDTRSIYRGITNILWRSCKEISKTWRFVPEGEVYS